MHLNTAKRASFDEGSLDQYLREISQYPLITREEEVTLAQRIKQSDPDALDKLVRSHPGRGQQAARLPARHPEPRSRRRDLRARPDRIDRGSARDAQGPRGEDPAALLRPRRPGADDPGRDRLAAGHHARAGPPDQGKGTGSAASRLESPGAGELPLLTTKGVGEWGSRGVGGRRPHNPTSPRLLYNPGPWLVLRRSTSPRAPICRKSTTP